MSLSGIGSVTATQGIQKAGGIAASATGGGSVPYAVGTTAAGGYMAQGSGAPEAGGGAKSLVTKMLAGAVVGAGLGFGASFIPIVNIATPILIAAGAAVGALGGLAMHFIGKRKQNLAMQAQAQAAQQQAMAPTAMPAQGVTLRANARGPAARKLQTELKTLGLYDGKLNGTFDTATSSAVRKYEVLKGVVPTGQASADVRAAVAQDVSLLRQYG